ncbi:Flagellar protein FlgN [Dissulfuribacter thermophilus]|uniref:Flagellar protein FlgN n=1 Tax=Dissulfuribacter thermophilus TaxID=1156395 RepID=A0A1B9F6J0_9BACT|nr:hypothetical protein [Dissulfuribacter thermophilus]OCC15557.1 Flagellar protein FlgN [Dissulfuribacter thermophilus]
MKRLPRLSHTFWAYLNGLTSDIDRLLEVLEKERISLLERQFSAIYSYAKEKENLVKKVKNGEDRLLKTVTQILTKMGVSPKNPSIFDEFKNILDFNDFLRFEKWFLDYTHKKKEVQLKNQRNLNWAKSGLAQTIELSKILMKYPRNCNTDGAAGQCLYNSRGQIREGLK